MPELVPQNTKSWGRLAASQHLSAFPYAFGDLPKIFSDQHRYLPFGLGRSYGDSCLNSGGVLIQNRGLNRLLAFDRQKGVITCEAGVSLAELLEIIVPAGWFLPVTPGTKFVTVGGAIANDVHGKNHHVRGTFGQHVLQLELLRSNGDLIACSPRENQPMFAATIGGLGLTGFIRAASIQLIPIVSPFIRQESIRFHNLDEYLELADESDQQFEYTVAWSDCMSGDLGRGILYRGYHDPEPATQELAEAQLLPAILPIPFDAPGFVMSSLSMKIFNEVYFRKQSSGNKQSRVHFDPFFYPLDRLTQWNRLYGPKGFYQYQLVIPFSELEALREIFAAIRKSGLGTSLVVFKRFADRPSPGLLSFPREGYTLALDFANRGRKTLRLFDELDQIVFAVGGRLYPAKDACMSANHFQLSYPNFREFSQYVDPQFSSDFWQRVTA
ncbi:MAG: FAD-binding oxidoreductase [Oligoflexus sp.]